MLPGITQALLEHLDVLVDGPFIAAQKNLSLRFRGSSNQRLIDMPKTLPPEQSFSGTKDNEDRRSLCRKIKIHYFSPTHRGCS